MSSPPAHATVGGTPAREILALAMVEGRRFVGHPIFLAGVGFAVAGGLVFVRAVLARPWATWGDDGWMVAVGFMVLGILTMVCSDHTARRDRRDGTREQLASLPLSAALRTGGFLTALSWPMAATTVVLVTIVAIGTWRGPSLDGSEAVQLAERVCQVATFGGLGIAVATWIPNPFAAPILAWAMLFVTPGETARPWHSLTLFAGLQTAELALWHLAYVLGLTACIVIVALVKSCPPRSLFAPSVVSVSVVLTSGAVLLTRACPSETVCLL